MTVSVGCVDKIVDVV